MTRVAVIANPESGRYCERFMGDILNRLRETGCDVSVWQTGRRGDAEDMAKRIDAGNYDVLAIAGGDGTISEAINGMADGSPPLAIIPLGTANVLAAEIDLTSDPGDIARTITDGFPRTLNLGVANGRRFIMMAGVGFDAHVVGNVDPRLKRLFGKGAYVLETFRQMMTFGYPRYRVTIAGTCYEASQIIIANGRHYGGRYRIAPKADISTFGLEICLLTAGGRRETVSYALSLLNNRLPNHPKMTTLTATDIAIEGPSDDPVHLDGDVAVSLPLRVRAARHGTRLMVPSGSMCSYP